MSQGHYVAGMRRQVGWFVMFGIGAVFLLLLMITVRLDIFAKKFTLYVFPPTATSFFLDQVVKFHGFSIGHVRDIQLQAHGQVRVSLQILEKYRSMLHEGASVHLGKEGLIGKNIVDISGGKKNAPSLQDQSSITYKKEVSYKQLLLALKPAVANADTLLHELVVLSKWLNAPDGDVHRIIDNVRQASKGIKEGAIGQAIQTATKAASQIHKLTHQMVENKTAEHLSASLQQTAKILQDIEPLAQNMGKQGPETMKRVNMLLTRLDKMTGSLNNIAADMEELTPQLPGLTQESRRTIKEIRLLIRGMRGSWLFGGSTPKPVKQAEEELSPPELYMRP